MGGESRVRDHQVPIGFPSERDARQVMSSVVSGWVWAHAPAKSGDLVVLLALADNAHDDGGGAYPSQATLAEKSRMTPRQVRNCLTSLKNKGLIEASGTTRAGTVIWRVLMTPPETSSSRNPISSRGGNLFPTEPSVNRPLGEREKTREKITFNGNPVNPEVWAHTVAALQEFNRQTGRSLSLMTGSGEPTESSKRIYGRLRHWPNLTDADIADIIKRTLASKWWGNDDPSPNVVFGPAVFEENMTRKSGNGNGNGNGRKNGNGNGHHVDDFEAAERAYRALQKA